MGTFWIITVALFISVLQVQASPISKTKIDRHQEGKNNFKFDLENVLILVMPLPAASNNSSSRDNILKFISRNLPLNYITQARKYATADNEEETEDEFEEEEGEEFIESKTAPYYVDISRAKSHLAKLYPEVKISDSIIARSPSVHLAKSNELPHHRNKHGFRNARAFLITVPVDNEYISRADIKNAMESKTEEVLKNSISLSMEAINNGLVEQLKHQQQTPDNDIIEPNVKIIKLSENGDINNIEKIDDQLKSDDNVSQAMIVAKAIKNVLIGYFKKIAEDIKEKNEKVVANEALPEEVLSSEKTKVANKKNSENNKKHDIKVNKKEEILKISPKPIKNLDDAKKESLDDRKDSLSSPKEELLLLGAENEQCGPGQERDSNGICVATFKI